jgi:steroid 5-alpha reductase family enzyme
MRTLLFTLSCGMAAASALMLVVWLVARRIRNNGIVDVAWAGSFMVLLGVYLAVAGTGGPRAWLLAALVIAWSARLTTYLSRRVASLHPVEDTRYQDLREEWAANLEARFFVFFQAQALAAVAFSLPHAIAAVDDATVVGPVHVLAAATIAIGVSGESLADYQLACFKANPRHRGAICQTGLWRYSRHPNYFFEWVVWCGFAAYALPSPFGAMGLLAPALMLYTLLRVTGIPATEEAAVKRRGDAYREYQRTTSAFVPWFPARLPGAR